MAHVVDIKCGCLALTILCHNTDTFSKNQTALLVFRDEFLLRKVFVVIEIAVQCLCQNLILDVTALLLQDRTGNIFQFLTESFRRHIQIDSDSNDHVFRV